MIKKIKMIGLVLMTIALLLLIVSCKPAQDDLTDEQLKAEMEKLPAEELDQIAAEEQTEQKAIAGQAYASDRTVTIGEYKVSLAKAAAIAKELVEKRKANSNPTVVQEPTANVPTSPPPPSLKTGECLKITLLPYNEKAVEQSKANRKLVCETISCKFADPQTAPPFKAEDDVCFGEKLTGCPKVAFYAFEGAEFQTGRENLCKSVSGCVYKQGKTPSQDTCIKQ